MSGLKTDDIILITPYDILHETWYFVQEGGEKNAYQQYECYTF